MSKSIECETPRKVRLIEVIETVALRGDGENTIARLVTQYWSKEGQLLAENDPQAHNDEVGQFEFIPNTPPKYDYTK